MDIGERMALWVARTVIVLALLAVLAMVYIAPAAIYLGILFVWTYPSGRRLLRRPIAQTALWSLLAATVGVVLAWAVVVTQVPQSDRDNGHWSWIPLAGATGATLAAWRHRRTAPNDNERGPSSPRTSVRP